VVQIGIASNHSITGGKVGLGYGILLKDLVMELKFNIFSVQKPEDYLVVSCKDDPTIIDESNNQNNRDHKNETSPLVVNQGQDESPNLISDMGMYHIIQFQR